MNVTVVQVQTPKTQMYLYWVRVTKQYNPNLLPIGHGFGFIVSMEEIEDW